MPVIVNQLTVQLERNKKSNMCPKLVILLLFQPDLKNPYAYKIYFRCYTSRFLLFALLLYSSSDVISALLFSTLIDKGELGSCFSCPSRSPSPDGDGLRRLSAVLRRAVVASILSCPEFRAFSSARTAIKNKLFNYKGLSLSTSLDD